MRLGFVVDPERQERRKRNLSLHISTTYISPNQSCIMAAFIKADTATNGGQFGWFLKIGATPEAVAVLNDQPYLFTILLVVLVALILQSTLLWYIHYATMKPEQKKKKEKKSDPKKGPAKPPAGR
ncbi:hypothetical protein BJ170DRAFT_50799 [Xylariales sp. AK1849]|nr:hypothetical protein BJ170DRAFT_50799 [Xylariales sp. AK1849]